jgi:hypothetical protein
MRIRKKISQYRRDFTALYECEHCDWVKEGKGYDDACFHNEVIPQMECGKCGQKAPDDYLPIATRYHEGYQV